MIGLRPVVAQEVPRAPQEEQATAGVQRLVVQLEIALDHIHSIVKTKHAIIAVTHIQDGVLLIGCVLNANYPINIVTKILLAMKYQIMIETNMKLQTTILYVVRILHELLTKEK